MKRLSLYRKRIIPEETILLKDDEIVSFESDSIITKWKALKPRKDFSHGRSLYLLNQDLKISRFFDKNNKPIYIYCDIIESVFNKKENSYIFTDLLVDVIVYDNGSIKILDLDELAEAVGKSLITTFQAQKALTSLSRLLSKIDDGSFYDLVAVLENYFD
jgi:predicted RNA-binding protein associated with RNAse of E/G family